MIDNKILKKIAFEYGTCNFVFDVKGLKNRIEKIKRVLDGKIRLCYAIKANPFLLKYIIDLVDYIEVCSPGELEICIESSLPPDKIIYSGVVKGYEDIEKAIKYGVCTFTAESKNQLELVNKVCEDFKVKKSVLLRLNGGNQFGMIQEEMEDIIGSLDKYKAVYITGLHYFVSTQRKNQKLQKEDIEKLEIFFAQIKDRLNFSFKVLEYGPGLHMPLFEGDNFDDTLKPLEDMAGLIENKFEDLDIRIELGRFIVQECGYYLSKVVEIKKGNNTNYCFIDGGINHISYYSNIMGMKVPLIEKIYDISNDDKKDEDEIDYCICGSLCTINDVIARSKKLKNLNIGDILVFKNIGAYSVTEGIFLFLSRKMPKVTIVKENGDIDVVRDYIESYKLNIKCE